MYNYSTMLTPMVYHLNIHPTLANVNASSSQPTITSVLARRSCDAQQAEKITQGICKLIEMLPRGIVEDKGFWDLIN